MVNSSSSTPSAPPGPGEEWGDRGGHPQLISYQMRPRETLGLGGGGGAGNGQTTRNLVRVPTFEPRATDVSSETGNIHSFNSPK